MGHFCLLVYPVASWSFVARVFDRHVSISALRVCQIHRLKVGFVPGKEHFPGHVQGHELVSEGLACDGI